jgi:outer membrane protein OmpA-like peptidoglycan-associated protein
MRIRINRTDLIALALALVTLLALSFAPDTAFGQDGNTSAQQQNGPSATEGIVTKRNADTFTVRSAGGTETVVVLTDTTSVKMVRKGLFRRDRISGPSYILRGLRLKATGRGNADGQLVADNIRFDEQDLRTAQALESRVDPVETQANATQALAESNQQRISETEENAKRLAGQVDELSSVANAARADAAKAQTSADQAQSDANTANQRINGLDDYTVFKTVTVLFKSGSAVLTPEAEQEIDQAAASIQGETLKGWMVAVTGYADSTGKTASNRSLSERRANAVINYLVTKHSLPPRRLVQPFGYGSTNPVASNDTSTGRAQNRRVEISVLVSKGISAEAATQTASRP